ncbi:MAG TPA: hypothetical protein VEL82_01575 [Thermoplasmata archaeon]|nr:hypothetical protein [Thermoplasmata archaeon]
MTREEDLIGAPPGGRLDDRVIVTLQELGGRIAFSGLRRALGAHPEALARALRRLEREGLVERSASGYRALLGTPRLDRALTDDLRPIARVQLPLGVTSDQVLGRLAGRWFGSLRWVGVIDGPSGRLLGWARRDGSGYVLLGIAERSLRVYVPGGEEAGELGEAEDAAYEVLAQAIEALRPLAPTGSVARFAAGVPPPEAWRSPFAIDPGRAG